MQPVAACWIRRAAGTDNSASTKRSPSWLPTRSCFTDRRRRPIRRSPWPRTPRSELPHRPPARCTIELLQLRGASTLPARGTVPRRAQRLLALRRLRCSGIVGWQSLRAHLAVNLESNRTCSSLSGSRLTCTLSRVCLDDRGRSQARLRNTSVAFGAAGARAGPGRRQLHAMRAISRCAAAGMIRSSRHAMIAQRELFASERGGEPLSIEVRGVLMHQRVQCAVRRRRAAAAAVDPVALRANG